MNRDKIWHLFSRKLTGEASNEELYELQQLRDHYLALATQMKTVQQIFDLDAEEDKDYLEATYHLHYEKMKALGIEPHHIDETEQEESDATDRPFFSRNSRKVVAFAILLIIFTGSVFLILPKKETDSTRAGVLVSKEVITKKGANTKFLLPDGSTVWLNAGSKLDYTKFGESGNREVSLTGEAFFDVVKNPKRPFIIHTSNIDVKVLGTRFNVKAYPTDRTTETSLLSGSVEVFILKRGNERHLLKPNEKLVVLNAIGEEKIQPNKVLTKQEKVPLVAIQELTYKTGEQLAVEAAWTENKLSFVDKPFADLALELERWYNVKIIFLSNKAVQFHFTATFTDETIIQALEALKFSQDFKYIFTRDSIFIK